MPLENKAKIVKCLAAIRELEPKVPSGGGHHEHKIKISGLAYELYELGKDDVFYLLQDKSIRDLLCACDCTITTGYNFGQTNFWVTLVRLAKQLDGVDPYIVLAQVGETTYIHKPDASRLESKTVLLVGEKDFSFTAVFASTHPQYKDQVLATAYQTLPMLLGSRYQATLGEFPPGLLSALKARVTVVLGVDATRLSAYPFGWNDKFQRIQFNCPFADTESLGDLEKPKTKALVQAFLKSASPLLDPEKGRLHLAIQQPEPGSIAPGSWNKMNYQQNFGLTPQTTAACGLTFVKVLGDIEKRYQKKMAATADAAASGEGMDDEEVRSRYKPYIGKSTVRRVNQFIFKRMGFFFDDATDSGESEDEATRYDYAAK